MMGALSPSACEWSQLYNAKQAACTEQDAPGLVSLLGRLDYHIDALVLAGLWESSIG